MCFGSGILLLIMNICKSSNNRSLHQIQTYVNILKKSFDYLIVLKKQHTTFEYYKVLTLRQLLENHRYIIILFCNRRHNVKVFTCQNRFLRNILCPVSKRFSCPDSVNFLICWQTDTSFILGIFCSVKKIGQLGW